MRLISKVKDYYDDCQGADRERTPVYVRKEQVVDLPHLRRSGGAALGTTLQIFDGSCGDAVLDRMLPELIIARSEMPDMRGYYWKRHSMRGQDADTRVVRVFVLCCGELIPFWLATDPFVPYDETRIKACQSVSEMKDFVSSWTPYDRFNLSHLNSEERLQQRTLDWFDGIEDKKPSTYERYPDNQLGWDRWKKDHDNLLQRDWTDLHRQLQAPLAVLCSGPYGRGLKLVINPELNKLGFASIVDAWSMWQRIDTFLGNAMAVQMDPDGARTNAGVIHAHGFDECSFRNVAPGERKARRRANRKRKRGQG